MIAEYKTEQEAEEVLYALRDATDTKYRLCELSASWVIVEAVAGYKPVTTEQLDEWLGWDE